MNDRGLREQSNYTNMLARWVNGADVTPVKTVADLYTPVKGYKRLMGGMLTPGVALPNLTSPMVKIADAAHCDSKPRWYFRQLVARYLDKHNTADMEQIKAQLQAWQANKAKFDALTANAPYLQQISELSNRLADAANIGLQALNGEGNKDEQLQKLQVLKKGLHEVELAIVPEIEALVTGKLKAEPAAFPMF